MYDTASDSKILIDTVQKFMADEIYPHEDRVDKLGYVPDEIGKQIEEKSKEVGLFAANLPEKYGGGGLDYSSMMVVEREYGKTSHALHSWMHAGLWGVVGVVFIFMLLLKKEKN
jgi:acyl-CoA dehydrogenase